MRRGLYLAGFLILSAAAWAQQGVYGPGVSHTTTNPAGLACGAGSQPLQYDPSGLLFTCQSGTWVALGAGGTGVSSITWAIPSWLTPSPNPINSAGTQTFSPTTGQTSHQVIGTCGAGTTFAPCALVAGDLVSGSGGGTTNFLRADGTWAAPPGGGGGAFSGITSGTNTTAAMLVGTGASLGVTGTGTIGATSAPVAGLTGAGAGVLTWLATPSSANLATAVSDETGTGVLVFSTSPVLTTPNLGTPSAITLTNGTGLPLAGLASQAADTVVMRASGTSGSPSAVSVGSCSTASSALTYNTSTHAWGCNTISGSGTVNSGTANQVAYYATTGSAVSGDSLLTDSGTSLAYTGTAGISSPGFVGTGTGQAVDVLGVTNAAITTSAFPTNYTGWAGPTTGTPTFLFQMPNAAPSGATIYSWTTPSTVNGVSQAAPTAIGLASGVATWFTTPSSANLAAALTDETGTGAAVFASSPALTGTPDASGATQFKLPVSSTATTAANGELKYDTTNSNWHIWNGADAFLAPVASAPTNGNCVQWNVTTSKITLGDTGSPCGSGGGAVSSISGTGIISNSGSTGAVTLTWTGTSGGIPYFSSATATGSSAALTQYGVVIGGGAGAAPSSISADTTTTHALFATATAPAFRAIASADLPAALASQTSVNGTSIPASGTLTQTIASGTSALGTSSIASASCATVVTTAATGTASTDTISWNPNASIKAVTGYVPSTSGGLTIAAYPTTNNVNFDVCNWTSAAITPGAVTLNWRVTR